MSEYLEYDGEYEVTCPACSADQRAADSLLGVMGDATWHRCRECGTVFAETDDCGYN